MEGTCLLKSRVLIYLLFAALVLGFCDSVVYGGEWPLDETFPYSEKPTLSAGEYTYRYGIGVSYNDADSLAGFGIAMSQSTFDSLTNITSPSGWSSSYDSGAGEMRWTTSTDTAAPGTFLEDFSFTSSIEPGTSDLSLKTNPWFYGGGGYAPGPWSAGNLHVKQGSNADWEWRFDYEKDYDYNPGGTSVAKHEYIGVVKQTNPLTDDLGFLDNFFPEGIHRAIIKVRFEQIVEKIGPHQWDWEDTVENITVFAENNRAAPYDLAAQFGVACPLSDWKENRYLALYDWDGIDDHEGNPWPNPGPWPVPGWDDITTDFSAGLYLDTLAPGTTVLNEFSTPVGPVKGLINFKSNPDFGDMDRVFIIPEPATLLLLGLGGLLLRRRKSA